ncbi:MAG: Asp-tRNA(Asn)/Glu-tRNA(Gln) amidotransferase subunit GatA [Candidatus Mcinerneyibacterium aminivorans]|uniref:Glutamyl-tRNA(Gln) amidotransferase subunit A n=1 Tax=Candidatus Mcinerneyibacterium aminivorans TaxID=2703815 RepID=A0A5D0MEV7_9BACT|nr:MAG: Asp-tRNA(Asn)/Glu-tRNA(Gln) amidotransferase subunit GatA [Candidatus Mcinerneyibacterium aminivorans]
MKISDVKDRIDKEGIVPIVRSVIKNIKENDVYNSFLELNEKNAIKQAEKLSDEGNNDKPLYGVPVAVKDNIAVKNMKMTCGSKILQDYISPYNATVIEKLKKAGAIIIGKTNMDEFAMGTSNEHSAFGPVKNPLNKEYVPGGSSGGSAASVAGNLVPVSLGSDTGGSVRQPAAFTGTYGLKPTYGRVSRYGLTAFASSLDQIGPITNSMDDLVSLYSVITGKDKKDSTTVDMHLDDLNKLKNNDKKYKIGIFKSMLDDDINIKIKEDYYKILKNLQKKGHKLVELDFDKKDYIVPIYQIIAPAEASSNLARFDGIRYGTRKEGTRSKEELVSKTRNLGFGEEVKRRCLVGTFVLSSGYAEKYYKKALIARKMIKKELESKFDSVDIIATPTTPNLPFKIGEKVENILYMYKSDLFTIPANLSGLPALSIPLYKTGDFYTSVQLMGNSFKEIDLFKLGYEVEKITGGKK